MRFKPVPHYQDGFVTREDPGGGLPAVGRMMAQPVVETADGTCLRLDDVLGPWFAVIGFECDPLAALDAAELAVVERFRPRVVKVVESRAGRRHHDEPCVLDGTVVVEDVHNELRGWFQARGRTVALVRPDRYVAAMTTAEEFGAALVLLAGQLAGSRVP